jgi:hypothetical protein
MPPDDFTTANTVEHFRAKLAKATRDGNTETAAQARHDMGVALLERGIKQLVDQAPPLSPEQRDRLAALLRPSTADGEAA